MNEINMHNFRPLAGFDENCRCQWGLLRDRNVSLRNPISMLTGEQGGGMASRGLITSYNRSPELGFWKEGSECDVVEGRQDGFTMPALIRRRDQGRRIDPSSSVNFAGFQT